ncbi:MAG: PQQ-dependent sugar dehydrogenase [Rhodothermales bacterium]|nr:PQQ-dependent sugar dehydrogenase [Rhodothermales bacterium]
MTKRIQEGAFFSMVASVILCTVVLSACSDTGADVQAQPASEPIAERVVEGFDRPWGLAFLPDGRMLVTEQGGQLKLVGEDGAVTTLAGVPDVCDCGQGGLMDVELHPDYQSNGWLYLTYSDIQTDESGDDVSFTALLRAKLSGDSLTSKEVIYQAPVEFYTSRGQHFGSRIEFDEAGYVYFSIGDRGARDQAQSLETPNGKIHRLHADGRVPDDNPFVEVPGAVPTIWSYGHRNPQGLDARPGTGELWTLEHGPMGGDELNIVEPGANYGWPTITYGTNYDGTPITSETERDGMEQPVTYWVPSIAVSSVAMYDGEAFPGWQGDALVGSLRQMELQLVELDGRSAREPVVLYRPQARIRDVVVSPEGYPYLLLETGVIERLVPAA